MADKRIGIEELKREIVNKTKKKKIRSIEGFLETFRENYDRLGTKVWEAYKEDFEKDALKLKEEISNDNSIAYSRDWNWYYNTDNIANNDAVIATRDFIEHYRKDEFDSLYFFNLLFRQKDELVDNLDTPVDYLDHIKGLPLNEIQKHTLWGMLLYWHGGYPVNNLDKKYNCILKLVEREFLAMFPDTVTPEKQFCSGDKEFKVQLKEVENLLNRNVQVLVSKGKVYNIEFDFEDLPLYIRTELSKKFDQNAIRETALYEKWVDDLQKSCTLFLKT